MSVKENDDQEREREVDETLSLIDHLDAAQARSILRCVAIDEENFDTHALAIFAKTVRATCDRSRCDYDASVHFPDGKTARLNREHLLKSRAASAEAERAAPQATEHAYASAQLSPAPAENSNVDNCTTTNGSRETQQETADGTLMHELDDHEFKKLHTRRLIRDGHVTINHYYMSKGPEVQPQPEPPKPEPKPEPQHQPQPQPKRQPNPKPKPEPEWLLCDLCDKWYLEKENVLQDDGRPPCGYHTGQVINYGNNEFWAWRNYGVRMTGKAWNCCRRRPNAAGCHPEFHEPADSSDSE